MLCSVKWPPYCGVWGWEGKGEVQKRQEPVSDEVRERNERNITAVWLWFLAASVLVSGADLWEVSAGILQRWTGECLRMTLQQSPFPHITCAPTDLSPFNTSHVLQLISILLTHHMCSNWYLSLACSFLSLSLSVSLHLSIRKPSSWTGRSSSPCCGACVPWHIATWRSSRSTPSSTWQSGSCASSPARCPGPVCCASGTCSSARVSTHTHTHTDTHTHTLTSTNEPHISTLMTHETWELKEWNGFWGHLKMTGWILS